MPPGWCRRRYHRAVRSRQEEGRMAGAFRAGQVVIGPQPQRVGQRALMCYRDVRPMPFAFSVSKLLVDRAELLR